MKARVIIVTFVFVPFCFSCFDTLGGPGECKTCLRPSRQLGQVIQITKKSRRLKRLHCSANLLIIVWKFERFDLHHSQCLFFFCGHTHPSEVWKGWWRRWLALFENSFKLHSHSHGYFLVTNFRHVSDKLRKTSLIVFFLTIAALIHRSTWTSVSSCTTQAREKKQLNSLTFTRERWKHSDQKKETRLIKRYARPSLQRFTTIHSPFRAKKTSLDQEQNTMSSAGDRVRTTLSSSVCPI